MAADARGPLGCDRDPGAGAHRGGRLLRERTGQADPVLSPGWPVRRASWQLSPPRRLPSVGHARRAADAEAVDAEHAPRVGLVRQGYLVKSVPGGCDEQRRAIRAAERARCRAVDGNRHGAEQRAVRAVAPHCPAAPQRDPDVPSFVDGEPVRRDTAFGDPRDRTASADTATCAVEVERVDAARSAVGEIHGGAIRAPADPVGDRESRQDGRATPVKLEPIEHPGPGRFVMGHRSGPKPALWIAGAVIHAHVVAPSLRLGEVATIPDLSANRNPAPAARTYPPPATGATAPTNRSNWIVGASWSRPSAPRRARCNCDPTMSTHSSSSRSASQRGPSLSSPGFAEQGTGTGGSGAVTRSPVMAARTRSQP